MPSQNDAPYRRAEKRRKPGNNLGSNDDDESNSVEGGEDRPASVSAVVQALLSFAIGS